MSVLKIGLNENISNAEYHKDAQFLSSSDYKTLLKAPDLFYREKILGKKEERKESTSFEDGSLVHSLILEPHLVATEYAIYEGLRKSGAQFEAFKATVPPGKTIVSRAQMERCKSYVLSFKANPIAVDLIKGGFSEQTLVHEWQGVPTKVRTDYINVEQGLITDVKTSSFPVHLEGAKESIKKWQYDISAALYCAIAELHYGKPFDFMWLFICKSERDCQVYKMSESTRSQGLSQCLKAARIYKENKASGLWLPNGTAPVTQPKYEIQEI